jgi:C4-dicarboxylate-binding protein DctP
MNVLFSIGKIPEIGASSIPAFYNDIDHYYRCRYDRSNGGGAMLDLEESGWRDKGNIVNLSTLLYSPNDSIMVNTPLKTLDDFSGKKIRSWGKQISLILYAWGASPVIMSSSEVYMALQRGTIEGAVSGMSSFRSRKWFEVAKNIFLIDGLIPSIFELNANKDFWDALPADQKRVLAKAALKAELFSIQAAIDDYTSGQKFLESKGVVIYRVPAQEAQKMKAKARPAVVAQILKKTLGEDATERLLKARDATAKGATTTWKECCVRHSKAFLDSIK